MRIIVYQQHVEYNPLKDRSEEMGWTRVQDEARPTESQQLLWSKITVVFAVVLAGLGILLS